MESPKRPSRVAPPNTLRVKVANHILHIQLLKSRDRSDGKGLSDPARQPLQKNKNPFTKGFMEGFTCFMNTWKPSYSETDYLSELETNSLSQNSWGGSKVPWHEFHSLLSDTMRRLP